MERMLEESMGDDWRLFRAKLVAQEKATEHANEGRGGKPQRSRQYNKELENQRQMGNMFRSSTSQIFKKEKQPSHILEGNSIGNAAMHEKFLFTDPFVSASELPIHIEPNDCTVDKHRWAHAIDHIEPGCVLISNERIDGGFHQTVILIMEHHERTGITTGVVINR
jgi:putative transcriptional regulator